MQPQRIRLDIAVLFIGNYAATPLLVNCSCALAWTYAPTPLWNSYSCALESKLCGDTGVGHL